jgi:uncharacterized protein
MPLPPRVDVHLHRTAFWPRQPNALYRADLANTVPGLLAEMDANQIGYGISLPYSNPPSAAAALAESLEQYRSSQGRLLPVATVFPNLGEAEVARTIESWEKTPELVAIKLFPGYHPFYPHDRRLDPVYEYAHRRDLPVMFHQGDTLSVDGLLKFARPIEVDEVAVRYRDVDFVLCHLGNPWITETAEIVYKNSNVATDTSGLLAHPTARYFDQMRVQVTQEIARLLRTIGDCDRVLYGSDWPLESLADAVRVVTELPIPVQDQEKILGQNARRIFRIPGPAN